MRPTNVLPALNWLKNYRSSYIYFDLVSGINLGVSMIPKAMAYSLVAGLPPIYGLYASFIAPLVAILFGSNRILFTGPVGVMTVLVFTSLSPMAEPFSQSYVGLAATLSLSVGFIMLVIAMLRLTFMLQLISHAAVIGFVNAAALIIAATQLKYILGVEVPHEEYVVMTIAELARSVPEANPTVLALSLAAFATMILVRRRSPHLPEVIVALVPLTLIVYLLGLENYGVELVGSLPRGMPMPALPHEGIGKIFTLLSSAAVIAIVGMTETYSISKIVASNTKQRVDFDQEFRGQGLANIFTSMFQGYPVCGSFSGTSINWSSGARTGVSILIFSALVLLSITVLTPLFSYLPMFMLASIVILAVMKLFKPKQLLEIYRINRYDGVVALVTFTVSLALKPDDGIIVGIVLALALYVWNTMHTGVYVVTKDRETGYFVTKAGRGQKKNLCQQILILKPEGPFVYVNSEHMRDEILSKLSGFGEAKVLLLDMAAVYYMDASGADAMGDLVEELQRRDVKLSMIHLEDEVLSTIRAAKLEEKIELHETKKEAISSAFAYLDKGLCKSCDRDIFKECRAEVSS